MKTVNWLESEITQTASEIRGLLSSSDILYWFVWEEGLLLGGKTKQRRADNTVRDPSVFVWEAGLLNTWGTELNKKLNLFLLLFVDSQKDACFCCCCAWDEEVSKMTVENVFKKQKQVLLTPQSPYRLLSCHNPITRWIISLQIQVWWQSLLRKWTVLLKNCPINWLGSGPEIKKNTFFFSIVLLVGKTEHGKTTQYALYKSNSDNYQTFIIFFWTVSIHHCLYSIIPFCSSLHCI